MAMAAAAEGTSRYRFKAAPYSSHTLLLAEFPERGEGRRVLDAGCATGYLSEIQAQRGFAVTSVSIGPTVPIAYARLCRRALKGWCLPIRLRTLLVPLQTAAGLVEGIRKSD
jgi:2-polyprenyl-3-methyl-5-hydroxy-6-metoxy-1,4-benzoquinol methylase